jgi:hypothetical protein
MTDGTTTQLDPERVRDLFADCLDPGGDGVEVEGIAGMAVFGPAPLERYAEEIRAMLAELDDAFRKSGGGGWSFLNACSDRHGRQWTGEHRTMEQLFMLGLAIGAVSLLMPRELWDALPGGMPYYRLEM